MSGASELLSQAGDGLVAALAPVGELVDQLTVSLAPVVVPAQEVFLQLDTVLQPVCDAAGFPMDQLRVLACLMLSTPLAFLFARLTPLPPVYKHLVSIFLGLFFSFYTIGAQTIHSFVSSLVVYVLVALLNRFGIAHKLVFVFAMTYMSLSHIYRMHVDYLGWSLDFTGPQMVITIKLTTFAFNCFDATRPEADLSKYEKERRIFQLPSLLEYYGWIYFFPGYLAGPSFDFSHYKSYCDKRVFEFPSTVFATLKSFVQSILCIVFVVFGDLFFPISYLKEDAFFTRPFYFRFIFVWVSTSLKRFNYYTAWGLAETAFIACGLGYNGPVDPKDATKGHKWNRVASYQLLDVEFAPNIRSTVMFWNMRTQQWLANYVYLRFPRDAKNNVRGIAVLITNMLSAAWHGWYSGYAASFATAALYTTLARELRRVVRPLFISGVDAEGKEIFSPYKRFYDVASWAVTMSFMSYSFCSFILLDGPLYVRVWESLYYLGHIIPIVAFIIIKIFFPPKR
eukprot:CAMPEP_0174237496 /NCGR_PEP_ID=MMETSP0417-20130205/8402_1 /TAXON_ID=242541 /ORGANISM="Mayorella sp, Strain BSH-02190019" /LENGTH=509 /DNA_ID=CAMNT_0015316259 /DNA_START=69 /DNA_END=1594 /DNA_ORIENTATION=+